MMNGKIRKMLLIVDPQFDFIEGSMPVEGASEAMDALAQYIKDHDGDYVEKVVTTDWHPYQHCSFTEQGGQWPAHCIQNAIGSTIHRSLIGPLNLTQGRFTVLRKGIFERREEYSIFKNNLSAARFRELVAKRRISQIDVCGIAGDICVLNTLRDGVAEYGVQMFHVMLNFSPSIDGGQALRQYVEMKGVSHSS